MIVKYGKNAMKKKKKTDSMWISLQEAILFCKNQGLSVTSPGLVYAGKHHHFIQKNSDGFHWIFNKEGLQRYVNNAIKDNPPGWITIREAAEKAGVCVGTVYYWINNGKVKAVQYGRLHLYYIEESKIMEMKK